MTAADTIRAAIEKLETEKAASTAGPWTAHPYGEYWGDPTQLHDGLGYPLLRAQDEPGEFLEAPDAILIVTLHRTIDAHLAILREAEYQLEQDAGFAAREFNLFLPLARAILGDPVTCAE